LDDRLHKKYRTNEGSRSRLSPTGNTNIGSIPVSIAPNMKRVIPLKHGTVELKKQYGRIQQQLDK